MSMGLNVHVTLSPEVLLQEIAGEAVLLDLKSENYFGLDVVGTRVWRLLEQKGDLSYVHASLLDEYEVESDRLSRDLQGLIEKLSTLGLVSVQTQSAPGA